MTDHLDSTTASGTDSGPPAYRGAWHIAVARLRDAVLAVSRSPAAWAFAAIWLASAVVLTVRRGEVPFTAVVPVAITLVIAVVTISMTDPPTASEASPPHTPRSRALLQTAVLLVVIAYTCWSGLVFHGVVDGPAALIVLRDGVGGLGEQVFGPSRSHWLTNPLSYMIVPLIVLALLGARPPALGLAWGNRTGRVLLGTALPLLIYGLLRGHTGAFGVQILSNTMQNGPFEEFLFRGALLTRLRLLVPADIAFVTQALLFGVWHLGYGFTATDGDLLSAVAYTIVHQAVLGVAFGVLFTRTRSLIAPSAVHVLLNSVA